MLTHSQQAALDVLAQNTADQSTITLPRLTELMGADTFYVLSTLHELCDLGRVRRVGAYSYALATTAAPAAPQASGRTVTAAELIGYLNAPYTAEDLQDIATQSHEVAQAVVAYVIRNPYWRIRLLAA